MENSHVLITGGLGGLGSVFANECARRGNDLILVDRHPNGDAFCDYLRDNYEVDVRYFSCDLAKQNSYGQLIDIFQKHGFRFSGLINVVGREFEGPFLERTHEEIAYMMRLNLDTMLNLTLAVLRMRDPEQRFTLINIASMGGFFPMPYKAVYSSTKRFIINFSLALRGEISDFANVTVVCPGGLPTNPESMKKIFIQGFWGKMTAHDTAVVVRRTLNKARRNVPMYVPGVANKFLVWLSHVLPERWLAAYLSRRWQDKLEALELWRITEQQQGR